MNKVRKYFTDEELKKLSINKPTAAQLELTRNCNQKCIFCFRGCSNRKKFPDLKTKEWLEIFNKLWELGIDTVNFSGGEVLLLKEIEVLVREAKKRKFKVILNTNGTIKFNTDILRYIDEIVFSIHGIGDLHDRLTGISGSFKLVEENLSKISKVKERGTLNISTVLVKSNFFEIKNIYDYFSEKYGDQINSYAFSFSVPCFYGRKFKGESLLLDKKKIQYYINTLQRIPLQKRKYKQGLAGLLEENANYSEGVVTLPVCAGGKYKLVIDYKGDVYPCRYFMSKEYFCGNILKEDALRIWKEGKGFFIFRNSFLNDILPKECTCCYKKEKCFGGCKAFTPSYLKRGLCNPYEKDYRCYFPRVIYS